MPAKTTVTLTRIVCPHFWDSGPLPCHADEERQCVTAACGEVGRTVPLVIRWDARVADAEDRAKWLMGQLKAWGYVNVEVARGFGK